MPGAPGPQGNAKAKAQPKGRSKAPRRGRGGGDAPPTGSQQEKLFALHELYVSSLGNNGTCPRMDSEYKQRKGPAVKYEANAKLNATAGATLQSKSALVHKEAHAHNSRNGNVDSESHANGFTPKMALPRPRRISDHDVGQ